MARDREKQRGHSRAHHDRLKEAGKRKVTFWARPETQAALEALAAAHGSKDAAINSIILNAAKELGDRDHPDVPAEAP